MKILVPFDFTTYAEQAAVAALKLAKQEKATLHLLTAISTPLDWGYSTMGAAAGSGMPSDVFMAELPNFEDSKERISEKLNKYVLGLDRDGVKIVTETTIGFPWEQITSYAKENEIDLIMMGSHGSEGLEEFFIGSNAEKVVRFAECPVLTMHDNGTDINFKNLVFASSFYGETSKSFPKIIKFADMFGAHIHLLKVISSSSFETTRYSNKIIKDFIKPFNLTNYTIHIYNDTSVEKGVLNFAEDIDADIIAMETHGRKGLSHLFIGSIAEDITNHAKRPVLTVKIKEVPIKYGILFPGS